MYDNIVNPVIEAARAVDGSQKGHHTALITMICACAKDNNYLSILSAYCANRVRESKDSICTKATFAWLVKHFGLRVHDSGEVTRGREFTSKGFTTATLEAARNEAWYDLAAALAFKVPDAVQWSGAASTAVKMEVAGIPMPDKDAVYAAFVAAVGKYRKSEQFAKWSAEFGKQEMEAAA